LWTPARARLYLGAAAVAAFLPVIGAPARGWFDFSAFYAAGSLAFTPQVTQVAPILAFEVQHGLGPAPFVYPADVALLYVPFSWLPFAVAAALHVGVMLGLLVLAAVIGARLLGLPRGWAVLGALAWGPAAAGVVSGQNSSLALLLVAATAAALVSERQGMAGVLAGLLAYKPQLGAPLAGLLVVRARWVGVAALAGVLVLHYLAGVLATGGNLAWPGDWLHSVASYTAADFHDNGWQASSLPALGRRLELVTNIPFLALTGYLVGAAIVLSCLPALRRLPPLESVALACALGLVVSPHAWVYDATLLLPGIATFGRNASARAWPWQDRWLLAAAFAIGLTWAFGGFVGITLMPLIVVAAPFVLLREEQRQPSGRVPGAAPCGSLPFGQ
jgi:hypothetical protein